MYTKCIARNGNCLGCEIVAIDNREANDGIGVCYNRFIESRSADEDAWYVFCHEDFELLEYLPPRLDKLEQNALWGPIGAATEVVFGVYPKWVLRGLIEECRKDGTAVHPVGTSVGEGTSVETFDCQCLIVHSTLIHRLGLRFDERLTFDLYVEDFCISAMERVGIISRILPIKARHWSGGSVQPRYYEQEAYLNDKWPRCCYTGTSSWIIGGKASRVRRVVAFMKSLVARKGFR